MARSSPEKALSSLPSKASSSESAGITRKETQDDGRTETTESRWAELASKDPYGIRLPFRDSALLHGDQDRAGIRARSYLPARSFGRRSRAGAVLHPAVRRAHGETRPASRSDRGSVPGCANL